MFRPHPLLLFMTCHQIINKSNMTTAISGAGTRYIFEALEIIPRFLSGSGCSIISFLCRVFWIVVCPKNYDF